MLRNATAIAAVIVLGFTAQTALSVDLGLAATLVSKLGVTQKQAEGGAGSILDYAKNNLSKDDFSKVASAIPETNTLLAAAPKTETSALGSLGSSLGGSSLASAAGIAALAPSFKKLGLSSDMVGKFVPVIVDYAQAKGGQAVSGILGKVLSPGTAAQASAAPAQTTPIPAAAAKAQPPVPAQASASAPVVVTKTPAATPKAAKSTAKPKNTPKAAAATKTPAKK